MLKKTLIVLAILAGVGGISKLILKHTIES